MGVYVTALLKVFNPLVTNRRTFETVIVLNTLHKCLQVKELVKTRNPLSHLDLSNILG
jgi:hypothetical protein